MESTEVTAQRDLWRAYFEQSIGGGSDRMDAAADAAMYAIVNGAGQAEAVAAGNAAAAGRRPASPGPRPTPRSEPTPTPARNWPRNSAVVAGIERRSESLDGQFFQVWSLRLQRLVDGKPVQPPIPVEIRGRMIVGQLVQGDVVEIPAGRAGQTRVVKVLRNHSTDSTIEAKGRPFRRTRTVARTSRLVLKVIGTLVMLAFLAVIGLVIAFVVSGGGSVSLP